MLTGCNGSSFGRLRSLRENYVVPGGLWLFVPLTQHSAFGYVLGYDMSRLRRLIFAGDAPPTKISSQADSRSRALHKTILRHDETGC